MDKDESRIISLSERMRTYYEDPYRIYLTRRTPVILRLDGKCFHTVTRNCEKPFDESLAFAINCAARDVCEEAQGAKFAYMQSDEINILLHDYERFSTDAWFGNNVQKMVSIAAARASVTFSHEFREGLFDCRAFNIPREEVCNYFISRQQDWERNSLTMFAQSFFSAKQLHNKKKADIHEMLHSIGQNWTTLEQTWKEGRTLAKYSDGNWYCMPAPIFKENRNIIEDRLEPVEV